MRTLTPQETNHAAGGKPELQIDVNVLEKHIHINVIDGDKVVLKLFNIDWSKSGTTA
jgi:hypothetical protein